MLHRILYAPNQQVEDKPNVNHSCHDVNCSEPVSSVSCSPCKQVYAKYVAVGEDKRSTLNELTKEQNNDLWASSRKFRITSTKVNSVPKTICGDPNKFLTAHLYNRFKGSIATKHGLLSKPKARK